MKKTITLLCTLMMINACNKKVMIRPALDVSDHLQGLAHADAMPLAKNINDDIKLCILLDENLATQQHLSTHHPISKDGPNLQESVRFPYSLPQLIEKYSKNCGGKDDLIIKDIKTSFDMHVSLRIAFYNVSSQLEVAYYCNNEEISLESEQSQRLVATGFHDLKDQSIVLPSLLTLAFHSNLLDIQQQLSNQCLSMEQAQ